MKKFRILMLSVFAVVLGLFLVACEDAPVHQHTYALHEAVEPTCTQKGNIQYYECSKCNRFYADMETTEPLKESEIYIDALGHTTVDVEAKAPTCTEEGNIHYYECETCGGYFEDAEATKPLKANDVVVEKAPHTGEKVEAVAPDCENEGSIEHFQCTVCNKTFKDEACTIPLQPYHLVIDALGHTVVEHAAVAADCENAGSVHYYECTVCNKYFEDEKATKELTAEQLIVPALGHAAVEHAAVAPDCENAGNIKYYECSVCHKYFEDAEATKELTAEQLVDPALGHDLAEHAAVAADCENVGSVHYYECSRCHKYFEDEKATKELTAEELVVAALGHTLAHHDAVVAVVGTPGSAEYYECSVCHKLYLDAEATKETTADALARYAYLITKNDAATSGYHIDYTDSVYTFVDAENNGVFVSNNKGVGSATSYMHLLFTSSGVISFDYSVSSESGWDKLTIYASNDSNGYRAVVSGISGIQNGTLTLNVNAGDYIYFQYSKDSSGNKNDDIATISNMVFITGDVYVKSVLTFVANGGQEVPAINAYDGVALEAPVTSKEGYFFDGWYADEALTTPFNFAAGLNGNATVYAKYTKGVNVTFANTQETTVEGALVRPNTAIEVPSVIPTSLTQYFKGWYADEACTQEFDFASGVAVDTVVYAGWRNPVVLTFVTNNGETIEAIATDINLAITLPADPVKPTYKFAGWYTDEACTVAFDATLGITENTTVYAKWLEQVEITFVCNGVVVGTQKVDNGSSYAVVTPEGFAEIIDGWFTDEACTVEYVDGTVLTENITIYAKPHSFAPEGVLESFANGDGSAKDNYPWVYDLAANTFTSGNKGVGNSYANLVLTFAKQSFVSFDYVVNSESNYDFIIVKLNGTQILSTKVSGYNGKDVSGSFTYTFEAGDVVTIQFKKDSSGNQGRDEAVISNLIINDGIPALDITLDYQDEGVADVVLQAGINTTVKDIENFASYAPADTDARHFGGWYYDEACTMPVGENDALLAAITLYAKYVYPATITFDTDGAEAIAPIEVWTNVDITSVMPQNPSKAGYIFRYWLDENAEEFDATKGVAGNTLLTAYFEELPVGSTVEEALVATLTNNKFNSGVVTTTEEFQNFYVAFTPEITDYYYFDFNSDSVVIAGGTVSYTSYRRYSVADTEGNVIISSTSSNEEAVLEAGKTYIATYNLAYGSYKAWGNFELNITRYEHDYAVTEAIPYEFGTEVTIPVQTFNDRYEVRVYSFTATETGVFAFHLSTNDWASVSVYSEVELTNRVAYKNASNGSVVVDLPTTAGTTYYIVLSQNWTGSEFLVNTMTFSAVQYPQGYDVNNPFDYTLGAEFEATFGSGANAYYQVEVSEAGTFLLEIVSISDTNSKTVALYNVNDLNTVIATYAGTAAGSVYAENLPAGTYVIKAYNTSTSYNTSFVAKFSQVQANDYWTTAGTITLEANTNVAASAEGKYYQFTTGAEKLWYFFAPTSGSVAVYNADRTLVGSNALQLEANTTYFFVATSADENVSVAVSTMTEYADGKSPSGAFTFSEENKVLGTEKQSYTVYYKFTATEDGTYRFYSNNNGSIDTKGYLYSDPEFKTQIANNDDGGNAKVNEGIIGYRYDFYFEKDLVAGETYYLKVTYTVYAANVGVNLFVNIEKA